VICNFDLFETHEGAARIGCANPLAEGRLATPTRVTMTPLEKNNVHVTGRTDASRTIVFVHGFGGEQSVWNGILPAYAADFRLVLLDNVGAGQSPPAAFQQHRYLSLRGYAQDLVEVGEHLGLHGAIFVGHSLGAMVGVLAAIARPGLFSRLVLIGASPHYLEDGNYHGGFREPDLQELYRAVTLGDGLWADQFAASAMAQPERPSLARSLADSLKSIPSDRALTVLCSIFQSDHRGELQRLERPTLLVQPEEDFVVPRPVAEFMHRQIRGSELRVVPARGHLPHITDPALVIEAMDAFVRA
jgi:sigma-B regulation protein RsbQ